ncbi:hypothetical protein P8935_03635 [Telmatobacter sp. DSM 110680]|uniref:Carrier domain-containing protein n=1 Tax=Telmatobacter sp. DSM 110680 TaxID=3036704 RepID=A0AAU7DM27_9BACT
MKFPSFEELAEVVRVSARLKLNQRIDPDTQLLRDLKLNDKTGVNVLSAIERHYEIRLSPEIHNHIQNIESIQCKDADEHPVIQSLFAPSTREEHPWTVGLLYRTVLEQLSKLPTVQFLGRT